MSFEGKGWTKTSDIKRMWMNVYVSDVRMNLNDELALIPEDMLFDEYSDHLGAAIEYMVDQYNNEILPNAGYQDGDKLLKQFSVPVDVFEQKHDTWSESKTFVKPVKPFMYKSAVFTGDEVDGCYELMETHMSEPFITTVSSERSSPGFSESFNFTETPEFPVPKAFSKYVGLSRSEMADQLLSNIEFEHDSEYDSDGYGR